MLGKRKSSGEVVDFTLLQKIRKKHKSLHATTPPAASASGPSVPSVGGFLDFTSPAPQSSHTVSSADASSTFGFLSDFAQSSSNSSASDVTSKLGTSDAEVNALKLKMEDVEYKLDRLLERLTEIETKFSRA